MRTIFSYQMAQYITPVVMLLILGGCAITGAQRQFSLIQTTLKENKFASDSCRALIASNPEYVTLKKNFYMDEGNIPFSYLKNQAFPTQRELRLFTEMEDKMNVCRQQSVDTLSKADTVFGTVQSNCNQQIQQTVTKFLYGKTSWGAIQSKLQSIEQECQQAHNVVELAMRQKLEEEHKEQIANMQKWLRESNKPAPVAYIPNMSAPTMNNVRCQSRGNGIVDCNSF